MPKFNVAISKRVFANIQVDADTAEEADRLARENYAENKIKLDEFAHFDRGEEAERFSVDWVEEA
jgi:hypothetical protein